jgi:type I restriction enzyme S subunit
MSETLSYIEKKTTLVPELRFKEFDSEWSKKKIGQILAIGSGKDYKHLSEGEVPVFGTGGLMAMVNEPLHEGETVFIGRKGTIDNPFYFKGKFWTVDTLFYTYYFVDSTPSFIYPIFKRINWYKHNEASGVPSLSKKTIESINVYLPSLHEQQKIASFLSAVDQKIQLLTRKKELLEQYKKGVMQQLFSQQIRFKDADGKEFPAWEWVGGNLLFDNVSDKNHNSDLPILAITQDQGAIPRDLINYEMTVSDSSVASYKVVQVGDFVISLRTFQGGIEYSNYHGICSPAYIILRPSADKVDRTFYKFYLKTDRYICQLQRTLEGIRDGKMISYKYFSEIKLPFPSLNEQQKISSFIEEIENRIQLANKELNQAQTFKKGLLQKMFV